MLVRPCYGWTRIMFGKKDLGSASYLTDVPVQCMEAMIEFLSEKDRKFNFSIEFDAEGYIFGIVEFHGSLYYIHDDTTDGIPVLEELEPELIGLEKYSNVNEVIGALARELIDDIQAYDKEWILWDCIDEDESEIKDREEKMKDLLIKLKNLI